MTALGYLSFLAMGGTLWAQASGCLSFAGERILAGELAGAWPEFAAVPADTSLCFAPAPGVRRVFRVAELERLAKRYNIAQPPTSEVCFERPLRQLTREDLTAAIQQQPGLSGAHVEIVEFSQSPVPQGEIVFPLAALTRPARPDQNGPVIWRGYVSYGSGRKFALWARARISLSQTRLIALEPLPAGQAIQARQLRLETWQGFPGGEPPGSVEQMAGRLPKRPISVGAAVEPELLQDPWDVDRGEAVRIQVRNGAAQLSLVGRAETAGRRGDQISVRNLKSGRLFYARVEGKGRAVVDNDGPGEKPL